MPAPKLKGARKATRYRAREAEPERAFDRAQSRLRGGEARMQSYDEVMEQGGDEDTFHHNRDKLLFQDDGSRNRSGRGGDDDDDLDMDDEIYSLNLSRRSPSGSPEPEAAPAPAKGKSKRPAREFKHAKPTLAQANEAAKARGRFGHVNDPEQDVVYPSSSEEDDESGSDEDDEPATKGQLADMAGDDVSDAGSGQAGSGPDDSEDEDFDRWAAGQYHASRRAPGEADSEDEEAAQLELDEARRLQRRARERLGGGDFGVEESDEDGEGEAEVERLQLDLDAEEKPAAEAEANGKALSPEQAIALLLRSQPETLALVDDFVLTASKIKQVEADLEVVRRGDGEGGEHPALAIMELEHQALSTYLPTLTFYFSLLLTPLSRRAPTHDALVEKVLARLSSLRQSLATMEELELTSAQYGAGEEEEEGSDEEDGEQVPRRGQRGMLASEALDFASTLSDSDASDADDDEGEEVTDSMLAGLSDAELEQLMGQLEPGEGAAELMQRVRRASRAKAGLEGLGSDEDEDEGMDEEEAVEVAPKPKRVRSKKGKSSASAAGAVPTLAPASSSARSKPTAGTAGSDYLDPLSLSLTDLADKSAQRRSLRFHVSQVAQKAKKREARRVGLEGDDDVPRRSKEQARRAVLQRQEHGAAKDAEKGTRLDGGEFGEEDLRDARAVRGDGGDEGEGEGGDEYYDLVAAEKEEGRRAKKARYDEGRAAEREEILSLAESSVDGPRQATRQILSNKGLTPKRKKENRNARVKKRLRYDKAQKKLGSMKATYRGGEARTGYEGEQGGISRRNVKSRKLG
ncbi:hypothetical protein JCM10207_006810 [Rhodosporidiobolus poonsookiae]